MSDAAATQVNPCSQPKVFGQSPLLSSSTSSHEATSRSVPSGRNCALSRKVEPSTQGPFKIDTADVSLEVRVRSAMSRAPGNPQFRCGDAYGSPGLAQFARNSANQLADSVPGALGFGLLMRQRRAAGRGSRAS